MTTQFEIKENLTAPEWDSLLAEMRGHPLQSAHWGDARQKIDGIRYKRLAVFQNSKPVYLARIEERRLLKFIKIAWLPKGPASTLEAAQENLLRQEILKHLKKSGFMFCVTNPWKKSQESEVQKAPEHTIWIDLTIGKEKLWSNISSKCRSDVRRALKKGLIVEQSQNPADIKAFYALCHSISQHKGFKLNASEELMLNLLENTESSDVKSHLFIARHEGNFCGGALVLRCGENSHYLWGGVDRVYSKLMVGETLQWQIIEWQLEQNAKLYDLEGIDLRTNMSTYNFKRKLGGTVIPLPGKEFYPLNALAKLALVMMKWKNKLKPAPNVIEPAKVCE